MAVVSVLYLQAPGNGQSGGVLNLQAWDLADETRQETEGQPCASSDFTLWLLLTSGRE